MGLEIERKFLVVNDSWQPAVRCLHIRQGYLAVGPPSSVRVRIQDSIANLNVKRSILDIERDEYEYPIPVRDAEEMLDRLCDGRVVEKMRHHVEYEGMLWEVDVFAGANVGLVVAEIELESEDQEFSIPPWVGEEVSRDARFLNSSLSTNPYGNWSSDI